MRNLLARNSDAAHEPLEPAPSTPRPIKASRQRLASERIQEKIRLAKLQRARTVRAAGITEGEITEEIPMQQPAALIAATPAAVEAPSALTVAPIAAKMALTSTPATSRTKRLFDVIGAVAMLVALAPVMITLAVLVRRDGGPAIFGHRRIGSNGESFHCLKFRSMCTDAERRLQEHLAASAEARAEWERDFKLRDDPRITPLGQFLRRTSLDELPQLINVIRGEMSLVGPRPIVADEVARYGNRFVAYRNCRPGITGLWQVSGRNDVSYRARVRLDSFYAARWSFMKDVFILVRTISVVFRRSGAY